MIKFELECSHRYFFERTWMRRLVFGSWIWGFCWIFWKCLDPNRFWSWIWFLLEELRQLFNNFLAITLLAVPQSHLLLHQKKLFTHHSEKTLCWKKRHVKVMNQIAKLKTQLGNETSILGKRARVFYCFWFLWYHLLLLVFLLLMYDLRFTPLD